MTLNSYSDFLPEVTPFVHDVPEFVAVNAIRNACIEFCEKSDYLVYVHDPISLQANEGCYDLDLPTGTTLCRVLAGWVGNLPVTFKSQEELSALFHMNWRGMVGNPQYLTQLSPDAIMVVPIPATSVPAALSLIVAIKPLRSSTTVDSSIYERWAEKIGFGARARLHDTPNQPYYDPASALKFRAWFSSAIGEAKMERNRGLTRTTLRVRPPKLV